MPEVQLIPIEHEGHTLLEVKVKAGTLTPYYYYQDGTRTAYVRDGNESVECNSQQLLSLALKGTHMTWDSLPTQVDAGKHSFIILANTFREQTHQEWNDKYMESFGLVTPEGKLTRPRHIQIPSMRRNPVIADVFTQLDYMEKRGSGLRKMRELTEKLPNFLQGKEPQYQTEATSFYTTFHNLNWNENGRIPVEEVANKVNSTLEKYPVNEESSVEKFGVNSESSVITFGDTQESSEKGSEIMQTGLEKKFGDSRSKSKSIGKTAQKIIDFVISDPSMSAETMAYKIGISSRSVKNIFQSFVLWEYCLVKEQIMVVIGAL